jgi:hypothetical protein
VGDDKSGAEVESIVGRRYVRFEYGVWECGVMKRSLICGQVSFG